MTPGIDRRVDASRLNFPLALVVVIVASALSGYSSVWFGLGDVRSDVRDIRTRDEWKAKLDEERWTAIKDALASQAKRADDRADAQAKTIDEMRKQLQLLQLQYQELSRQIGRK